MTCAHLACTSTVDCRHLCPAHYAKMMRRAKSRWAPAPPVPRQAPPTPPPKPPAVPKVWPPRPDMQPAYTIPDGWRLFAARGAA